MPAALAAVEGTIDILRETHTRADDDDDADATPAGTRGRVRTGGWSVCLRGTCGTPVKRVAVSSQCAHSTLMHTGLHTHR